MNKKIESQAKELEIKWEQAQEIKDDELKMVTGGTLTHPDEPQGPGTEDPCRRVN